jgi:hypothetical protein
VLECTSPAADYGWAGPLIRLLRKKGTIKIVLVQQISRIIVAGQILEPSKNYLLEFKICSNLINMFKTEKPKQRNIQIWKRIQI